MSELSLGDEAGSTREFLGHRGTTGECSEKTVLVFCYCKTNTRKRSSLRKTSFPFPNGLISVVFPWKFLMRAGIICKSEWFISNWAYGHMAVPDAGVGWMFNLSC